MNKTRSPHASARRGGRGSNGNGAVAHASHATLTLAAAEEVLGIARDTARERHERLTAREREVAGLMASGTRNQDIAEQLGISPKTLDIHRANVMDKLAARTTATVANLVNLLRLAERAEHETD